MQLGGKGVQSEINVTPLIDVVLVLLIIFMVVVPLVESRFVLAVPESDLQEEEPEEDDARPPLLVRLESDGSTKLNDEQLPLNELVARLERHLKKRPRDERVVFFDAADGANFGVAVDTMDACRGAGARHVGIIDPEAVGSDLPTAPVAEPSPIP